MSRLSPPRKDVLLFFMLLIALFLPRGLGLDRFVTVDEPKWLVRSASFYAALAHGNFQETFQREHPGVTITWAGTAGFLWRFPGYYKVVPDVSLTPTRFHNFLRNSGQSSLDLLVAGRLFVVLGIVVALGLAYLLAARMLGALPAAFAFLLVALDPFPVALSRLLHLDGLLSALMLLSLLAFTAYSYYGRRRGDLLLSAMAAGLAWLTKSPAFFLAPFFGLFILVEWVRGQRRTSAPSDATVAGQARRPTPARIWWAISPLLLWFLVAAVVFVLLWPAMWVDPLGSLGGVFSQATTYASEGHEHPGLFYGKIYPGGDLPVYFYPVAYLWRATPVTLLGLALALLALLFPRRLRLEPDRRRFVAVLLVFSLLFTTFMSIGAKKFDRYLLPVFAPLDLVAALGYLVLIVPRGDKESQSPAVTQRYAPALLLGLALMGHAIGLLQTYPYYFNYYNPLLGGHRKAADMLLVGWGEGLDQAAAYLNEAERNEKTRAIAWYGDGCLSYFYEGSTIPIGLDTTLADLRKTDYVVLYRNQWQRQLPTEAFLDYFENLTPVYVVSIDGIEYVRIYRP